VAVFMSTDPVSAPKRDLSQWIYGLLIGILSIILRLYSAFPEGTSFALLLGNTFASLIDELTTPKAPQAKEASV
jgi:Na+-transporting NADH:ubiquinone oxidoreductase subunit B